VEDITGAGSGRASIVLVDDHAVLRRGLRLLLALEEGLPVVAEAADAASALELVREHQPDVLVLDLNMPGRPTLEAIPDFLAARPGLAIVIMTMEADPLVARAAITAGAQGYVLKDAAETELVAAVRTVLAGGTYLDPGIGARLAATPLPEAPAPAPAQAVAAVEPVVGSTFADHRLDAVAGRGGMAVVYRATDLMLDRTVALKLITPAVAQDPWFRARFDRERRLAATVDHPRVVPIYRAGEERGHLYLTMRYIDGTDLRHVLFQGGRLDPGRAVEIVTQVADALDAAHEHGLVHRDVKPANVLLSGRDGQAFLTDFGVSRTRLLPADETGLTRPGFAVGTPDYMAPEQAEGTAVDGRADVYSLGCVLFHALSGAVPYELGSELEKLYAHKHQPPPALAATRPDLPPAISDVLERALAKDPRERPPTAGTFARESATALAGEA
jgi:DNA-binding NarL/FixJ family response regulator